ncbi:A24 family peptidase, partial [Escherichia coli]|nr:A24 family peptidase [Escherichia coli]
PDQLTLPLTWAGIALALTEISPVSLQDAVIGAIAGYLCLWSVYWGFKLLTGKEGMGYGDFKLLAALGAWLGWQSLPMIILLSSVVGVIFGLVQLRL